MSRFFSFFKGRSKVFTVIVFLFFSFGLLVICLGIFEMQSSLFAKNWHKTQGKILKSKVEPAVKGGSTNRGRNNVSVRFKILVEYSYVVSNQKYIGNRRNFSDSVLINEREAANKIVESLPVDGIVDVYYSPNNPEQSVLDPSFQNGSVGLCIFGLVFVLLSFSIFFSKNGVSKTGTS